MKRTIRDLADLKGKVVLLRVDFNVPLDDAGKILDATRVANEIPTIQYLSDKGARIVIISHLGRPKGFDIRKSLWPITLLLSKKLKCNVTFCNYAVGDEVKERISLLGDGDVLLLENIRFYEGETTCDMDFARELASLGKIFVDDAFGVAHRENASNYGVARLLPNAIGFLMEREIKELTQIVKNPKKPFVAIIGGAKVETKAKIIDKLLDQADTVIIGGAMAYTFLLAKGKEVGASIVDNQSIEVAREIIFNAKDKGKKLLLPIDHVCMKERDKSKRVYTVEKLQDDMVGYDIGPKTAKLYAQEIASAGQVFWNGPMGMYEDKRFIKGSKSLAQSIANSKAYSVVGGGDTVAIINQAGLAGKINFISTGGGASLKFIEEGTLPAIEVIQEKTI